MRVSKQQAAENRGRILHAAAALIRERGIAGVGVDALTEAAGLTHGSVYSQFGSKDRLTTEALALALELNAMSFAQTRDLRGYVAKYLSSEHLNAPGRGCALAALGCEASRASEAVRIRFTTGVRRMVDRIGALLKVESKHRRDEVALAATATMVGAMILSRAVDDPDLANRILKASRKALTTSGGG